MRRSGNTHREASGRRIPGLRSAAAVSIAVFLVGAGALAGNAAWTGATNASTNAVATQPGVSSTGPAGLGAQYKEGLSTAIAPVTMSTAAMDITNTGGTPLNYIVGTSGGTAAVSLAIWKKGASCDNSTAPAAGATFGTFAAAPGMPTDASSAAAGATISVCVRTTYTGGYPAATMNPSVTVTGRVGDNWSASTSNTFTVSFAQSWARVAHNFSGKCLDARGASSAAGTDLIVWPCKAPNKTDNQAFRFAPTGSGNYRIYLGNGSAAGPVVAATAAAGGSTVALAAVDAASSLQLWTVEQHGTAGDYRMRNVGANRCLAMTDVADETVFVIKSCNNTLTTSNTNYREQHFSFTEIP